MVEYIGGLGVFFGNHKGAVRWSSIREKSPRPHGPKLRRCCLRHPVDRKGVVNASLIVRYSKGFYGSYAVALVGRICPADTLALAPVGAVSKNGKRLTVWLHAWRAFLGPLDAQGQLAWHAVFADGTFAGAKKGGSWSEKPTVERVRSVWWWQTARVCLGESNWPRLRPTK